MYHGYGTDHLIATPILLPIATSIGIDPVQFGIIMVLNCGIGLLTDTAGWISSFIGSAVSGVKMERVVKATTLPFYLCMIVVLLLLTLYTGIKYRTSDVTWNVKGSQFVNTEEMAYGISI